MRLSPGATTLVNGSARFGRSVAFLASSDGNAFTRASYGRAVAAPTSEQAAGAAPSRRSRVAEGERS